MVIYSVALVSKRKAGNNRMVSTYTTLINSSKIRLEEEIKEKKKDGWEIGDFGRYGNGILKHCRTIQIHALIM